MQPAIYGIAGERLNPEERAFFRDADPAGYILFKRNCAAKDQLRRLTDDLRALHGRDEIPILIDQEGGRVARLQPPDWPEFPAAECFDRLYRVAPISAIEAARLNAEAIALMLRESGISVNCLPLLDVRQVGGHDIIGDRALGSNPMQVAALGRAIIDGMAARGVTGVVKHMPGHGRASVDSHKTLPVVDASEEELEIDLAPFRTLRSAAMAMTAHIVFTAWDPSRCASLSPIVIGDIIRGRIGFDGLLMSDDLAMAALSGSFEERGRGVIAAGCDLALHCSGEMDEMVAIAGGVGEIGGEARARLARAVTIATIEPASSYGDLAARRDALLSYA